MSFLNFLSLRFFCMYTWPKNMYGLYLNDYFWHEVFFRQHKHYIFKYGSQIVVNLVVLTWKHIIDDLKPPSLNSGILTLIFMSVDFSFSFLFFFFTFWGIWSSFASRGRNIIKRPVSFTDEKCVRMCKRFALNIMLEMISCLQHP